MEPNPDIDVNIKNVGYLLEKVSEGFSKGYKLAEMWLFFVTLDLIRNPAGDMYKYLSTMDR